MGGCFPRSIGAAKTVDPKPSREPADKATTSSGRMDAAVPLEFAAGRERLGVQVKQAYRIGGCNTIFVVAAGSVCDFEGDAIVNAANEGCICGGGVDGQITSEGGRALAEARQALPIVAGTRAVRCRTGEAVITIGGELKNPYCIHAVGPNYNSLLRASTMEECDEFVSSAYRHSMFRAQEKALKNVAFSLLSSGIFRGPQTLQKVLQMGVQGVLQGTYPGLEEVHLVAFTREEQHVLQEVCDAIERNGEFNAMPAAAVAATPVDTPGPLPVPDAAAMETNEPPPEAVAVAVNAAGASLLEATSPP